MIKNSFKQLFRKPGKALLFFCLMAAATMLMVFGASMYFQSVERISAARKAMTTIGYIEQPFEEVTSSQFSREECPCAYAAGGVFMTYDYGEVITPDQLLFEGYQYVVPPESRPYYIAYNEDLVRSEYLTEPVEATMHYEFTLKEDSNGWKPVELDRLWAVYLDEEGGMDRQEIAFSEADATHPAVWQSDFTELKRLMEISISEYLCQHNMEDPLQLKAGTAYACRLYKDVFVIPGESQDFNVPVCTNPEHDIVEWVIDDAVGSSQCDRHGNLVDPSFSISPRVDEVTPDFYTSGRGTAWLNRAKYRENYHHSILVTAPRTAELLPSYRQSKLRISDGRMITAEEFESGAKVCLMARSMASRNLTYVGDKVDLPLICSMYNTQEAPSLLDANGRMYEPFWEAEYEVVGIYDDTRAGIDLSGPSTIVIPFNSVGASDENNIAAVEPMTSWGTVFQLENGAVEEFDAAFKAAFPGAERLNITYDDNGYAEVMESMEGAQRTALLLFAVGVLAALAIVVLLMYFFIIRERKRTAVERSLGLSRRQCRISLMAGLMTLTVCAAVLGSALGGLLLENADSFSAPQAQEEPAETQVIDWGLGGHFNFNSKFSLWPPRYGTKADLSSLESIDPPAAVYLFVPLTMCGLVLVLAAVLVNRSLKIEPILLLSVKT